MNLRLTASFFKDLSWNNLSRALLGQIKPRVEDVILKLIMVAGDNFFHVHLFGNLYFP